MIDRKDLVSGEYYWYLPDPEDDRGDLPLPCQRAGGRVYDIYFIGSEVGETFDELYGTFEPLIYFRPPPEIAEQLAKYREALLRREPLEGLWQKCGI